MLEAETLGGRIDRLRVDGPVFMYYIYVRTEKGWRMVAHHASPAPASPEGKSERGKVLH